MRFLQKFIRLAFPGAFLTLVIFSGRRIGEAATQFRGGSGKLIDTVGCSCYFFARVKKFQISFGTF
jgi:hypothetical protein